MVVMLAGAGELLVNGIDKEFETLVLGAMTEVHGRLGYIHISEDPLDDPYDGEFDWPSTWRDRFFEEYI